MILHTCEVDILVILYVKIFRVSIILYEWVWFLCRFMIKRMFLLPFFLITTDISSTAVAGVDFTEPEDDAA